MGDTVKNRPFVRIVQVVIHEDPESTRDLIVLDEQGRLWERQVWHDQGEWRYVWRPLEGPRELPTSARRTARPVRKTKGKGGRWESIL